MILIINFKFLSFFNFNSRFECRRPDSCARACPSGTKCDDGECMCTQIGYVYDFGSYR